MGKCFLIITIFFLFWSCGYQKAELEKYEDWNCKDFTPCKFDPGWRNNTGNKCPAGQHEENGKCISNTRECEILNAKAEEKWINTAWDICRVKSCNAGSQKNGNQCIEIDLKSCKARRYDSNAKTELKLTDKNWCGDINGRFKLENKGNDFIYDAMLRDQEFASERIMEIVMSLRQFARPDREEKELVDISEVIKSSVTITRSRTKKVKIENQLKSKLEFLVFPGKLAQIVGNLLVNAADALENIENPRINIISSLNFDGELEILVCDNGPGISKEIQNKIFDPFFTTKDVGKGTGLGLSLCKKFIEEMGGSLKLKTEPGETIFIITLPKV